MPIDPLWSWNVSDSGQTCVVDGDSALEGPEGGEHLLQQIVTLSLEVSSAPPLVILSARRIDAASLTRQGVRIKLVQNRAAVARSVFGILRRRPDTLVVTRLALGSQTGVGLKGANRAYLRLVPERINDGAGVTFRPVLESRFAREPHPGSAQRLDRLSPRTLAARRPEQLQVEARLVGMVPVGGDRALATLRAVLGPSSVLSLREKVALLSVTDLPPRTVGDLTALLTRAARQLQEQRTATGPLDTGEVVSGWNSGQPRRRLMN